MKYFEVNFTYPPESGLPIFSKVPKITGQCNLAKADPSPGLAKKFMIKSSKASELVPGEEENCK
jgi:hypothetical protein